MISDDKHCPPLLSAEDRGRHSAVNADVLTEQVVAYYERKTQAILDRYGPGPRVHYHTGFADELTPLATIAQLRIELRASQERMLTDAAEAWHLRSIAFRDVLDVGCGLGGGAIFWAQEFGSDVTAITNVPSHVNLVATFCKHAGVRLQVHPRLCDALEVRGRDRFDAIVAIDSSCHLNRPAWFRRAADLLRPYGRLFIADCFLMHPGYKAPFDSHWCTQIGTIEEYLVAAREARFTVDMIEDVSSKAAHFWATTIALMRAEEQDKRLRPPKKTRLDESMRVHSMMRRGLSNGGLRHALMSFSRTGNQKLTARANRSMTA